jgi:signal transduction histidine kinase
MRALLLRIARLLALDATPLPAGPPAASVTDLAVLWHEFRTPIVSVNALARALDGTDGLSEADRREMAQLIVGHARHLADMLDAVRLVADAVGQRADDVAVAGLVSEAACAAGLRVPGALVLEAAGDLDVITVDAVSLRRVLTNLLENARVHGTAPVHVAIEVAEVVTRRSPPHTTGRLLSLVVSDAGPGFPPPVVARVFAGGHRLGDGPPLPPPRPHATDARSGLGLWIVTRLVESMHGRLDLLAPLPPHVTRIRVQLPVG